MKTISLCILTKNNEATIDRCISSALSIVDEIIIVDTGSTDNTIEICNKYGAKIYTEQWDYNFSTPRNLAIDKASMDYILFLDSDEFFSEESLYKMKDLKNNLIYKGYTLIIQDYNNTGIGTPHPLLRLFINDKDLKYEHRVHELLDWSFFKKYIHNDIFFSDIIILHDGYTPLNTDVNKKFERNKMILDKYTEEEKDEYYYYLLGRDCLWRNDFKGALEFLNKAFTNSDKIRGLTNYILILRLNCMVKLNMVVPCLNEALYTLQLFNDFKDLYYICHICYIYLNDYKTANEYFNKYLNTKNDNNNFPIIYKLTQESIDANLEFYKRVLI